jgi:hypothetical protein
MFPFFETRKKVGTRCSEERRLMFFYQGNEGKGPLATLHGKDAPAWKRAENGMPCDGHSGEPYR